MNKHLLTSTFTLLSLSLLSQTRATRTTIMDGDANNPFTWDCTCVPFPGDDIVINHDLNLNVDFGYTSGSVTINSGATMTGDIATRAFAVAGGTFTNHGTVTVGDFYHGGGVFNNYGWMYITNAFASDMTVNSFNSGTLSVTDTLYINTNASLINSGTVSATTTATAGTLTNTGSFSGGDLYNSGSLSNSTGVGISISNLYTSGTVVTSANFNISVDLWNSENFTNSGNMIIGNNYWNGDTIAGTATFTNNGTISVGGDLANSETMDGSGDYCVNGVTSNAGAVNGTLDICDLTGTNFDNNFGTIAGTVTHCSSTCAIGIDETINLKPVIYPNPTNGNVNIELGNTGIYSLTVFNDVGETVIDFTFSGTKTKIDMNQLNHGIYFYRIAGNGNTNTGKIVKE